MPKPDPEVYQQLISFYAVPPEKVLVFEDILLGELRLPRRLERDSDCN